MNHYAINLRLREVSDFGIQRSRLMMRWMCAPAWLSPFFAFVVSHRKIRGAYFFLLLPMPEHLSTSHLPKDAQKLLSPGKQRWIRSHPALSVSMCKMVYVKKSHPWIIPEERHLNGKESKVCFQAPMKDLGKSSYMHFILVLCGQLGPILRWRAKYFSHVLAVLGLKESRLGHREGFHYELFSTEVISL